MLVAKTASSAFEDDVLFAVGHHFAYHLPGVVVLHHRTQWKFDHLVLATEAAALVARAHGAVVGDHVLGVAQVEQRP